MPSDQVLNVWRYARNSNGARNAYGVTAPTLLSSRSEGGWIGITARQADGSVEISVSDTRIGISPDDQTRIFDEFRQVGGDYAHKREGTPTVVVRR